MRNYIFFTISIINFRFKNLYFLFSNFSSSYSSYKFLRFSTVHRSRYYFYPTMIFRSIHIKIPPLKLGFINKQIYFIKHKSHIKELGLKLLTNYLWLCYNLVVKNSDIKVQNSREVKS